jgi:hypothetical protein
MPRAMKRSCLPLLAACGVPPDGAQVTRCDAPTTFADGIALTRVRLVVPGASEGDGSSAAPFGSIQQAAATVTRRP